MFNFDLFLQFAREVLDKKDEAYLRSSVSRAYYAAFHRCRTYLKNTGTVTFQNSDKDHGDTIRGMRELDYRIGYDMASLRRWRNFADYDGELAPDWESMSRNAIAISNKIVSEFRRRESK